MMSASMRTWNLVVILLSPIPSYMFNNLDFIDTFQPHVDLIYLGCFLDAFMVPPLIEKLVSTFLTLL